MRTIIIIAAGLSLAAATAFAQYGNQPAGQGAPRPSTQLEPATPSNPAAPSNAARPPAPQSGPALTETQAKSRIEAQGFTGVRELKEDGKGAWNAKAMKDGKPVQLSLDTQGRLAVIN